MYRFYRSVPAGILAASLLFGTLAVSAEETAYPLTVTDQLGREVTIESEPQTLASGYYISTSLLIALGLEDQLVGIEAKADTRPIYSLAAPQLLELPNIGTARNSIWNSAPHLIRDLVIVPARLKDSIPRHRRAGTDGARREPGG